MTYEQMIKQAQDNLRISKEERARAKQNGNYQRASKTVVIEGRRRNSYDVNVLFWENRIKELKRLDAEQKERDKERARKKKEKEAKQKADEKKKAEKEKEAKRTAKEKAEKEREAKKREKRKREPKGRATRKIKADIMSDTVRMMIMMMSLNKPLKHGQELRQMKQNQMSLPSQGLLMK